MRGQKQMRQSAAVARVLELRDGRRRTKSSPETNDLRAARGDAVGQVHRPAAFSPWIATAPFQTGKSAGCVFQGVGTTRRTNAHAVGINSGRLLQIARSRRRWWSDSKSTDRRPECGAASSAPTWTRSRIDPQSMSKSPAPRRQPRPDSRNRCRELRRAVPAIRRRRAVVDRCQALRSQLNRSSEASGIAEWSAKDAVVRRDHQVGRGLFDVVATVVFRGGKSARRLMAEACGPASCRMRLLQSCATRVQWCRCAAGCHQHAPRMLEALPFVSGGGVDQRSARSGQAIAVQPHQAADDAGEGDGRARPTMRGLARLRPAARAFRPVPSGSDSSPVRPCRTWVLPPDWVTSATCAAVAAKSGSTARFKAARLPSGTSTASAMPRSSSS